MKSIKYINYLYVQVHLYKNNTVIRSVIVTVKGILDSHLSMHFTFYTFRIVLHTIVDRFLNYVRGLNGEASRGKSIFVNLYIFCLESSILPKEPAKAYNNIIISRESKKTVNGLYIYFITNLSRFFWLVYNYCYFESNFKVTCCINIKKKMFNKLLVCHQLEQIKSWCVTHKLTCKKKKGEKKKMHALKLIYIYNRLNLKRAKLIFFLPFIQKKKKKKIRAKLFFFFFFFFFAKSRENLLNSVIRIQLSVRHRDISDVTRINFFFFFIFFYLNKITMSGFEPGLPALLRTLDWCHRHSAKQPL
ncbi:hypothetical protein PUN28_017529 [Cardiocondyla obscurior]|uniref:Uncharacterized protein n=1 Tax=Cardiocondyla obscurior TaxID=286306 RepID=A0AAW2EHU2_9HYME